MKEDISPHIESHLYSLCRHWGTAMRTHNVCGGQGYRCTLNTSSSDGASDTIDREVEHVIMVMHRLKTSGHKISREIYKIADKLYIEQKTIAEMEAEGFIKKTVYNRRDSLISHLYCVHYMPWVCINGIRDNMKA